MVQTIASTVLRSVVDAHGMSEAEDRTQGVARRPVPGGRSSETASVDEHAMHGPMNLRLARFRVCLSIAVLLTLTAVAACSGTPEGATETSRAAVDGPIPETPSPLDAIPENLRVVVDTPFTGDFDEMVKRRLIRVGVTFNRTHYFIDRGQERG